MHFIGKKRCSIRKISETIRKILFVTPNVNLATAQCLTQQILLFAVTKTDKAQNYMSAMASEKDKALKTVDKWQTQCSNLNNCVSEYKR